MQKDDRARGLYAKYQVTKLSDPTAEFAAFVLNLDTDPFAVEALRAYARACAEEFPLLAADLEDLAARTHSHHVEMRIRGDCDGNS